MSRINIKHAFAIALVAAVVACSDAGVATAVGPNTRSVQLDGASKKPNYARAIGPNTVIANGVSSSPSVQGVGTSPRQQP